MHSYARTQASMYASSCAQEKCLMLIYNHKALKCADVYCLENLKPISYLVITLLIGAPHSYIFTV